jgi:hypothetical protein
LSCSQAYLASQQGKLIDAEPISKQRAIIDRQGISSLLVDVERQLPQVFSIIRTLPLFPVLRSSPIAIARVSCAMCVALYTWQALQAQIRSPRYAILAQKADDYSAALAAEEVHFPASTPLSIPPAHRVMSSI